MNYITLIMAAITLVPILFGIILGLIRGAGRAILRLVLVAVCVVLAFVLCGVVTDALVSVDISRFVGGESTITVVDVIKSMLGESMQDFGPYITPLAQSIVKIAVFLLLFALLSFITWVLVFPLLKLIFRGKAKGHRLLGMVFGLVQGVVVALCVCIIVNGLVLEVGNIAEMANDAAEMSQSSNAEGGENAPSALGDVKVMVDGYRESVFCKVYSTVGDVPFEHVSSVETEDRGRLTLHGQIEGFGGLVKIGKEFVKVQDVDFDHFYEEDNVNKLTTIFTNVQNIRDGLSQEATDTVNGLINLLGDKFGVDLNLLSKLQTINFQKEAEIFQKLGEYKDKDFANMTEEQMKDAAKDIVESLGESDLLLDMLAGQDDIDLGNSLDDQHLDEISKMLEETDLSQEKKDQLRNIFGLNNNGNNGNEGSEE